MKLNAKMKDWLSGIVYEEKTINRIATMCTFQMTDYTSPYDAPQYQSVSADSWKLCKFFKEQLAQNLRDILFIDDSIHASQTVKEAVNIINSIYNPKSVTVLTLFSKLYPSEK